MHLGESHPIRISNVLYRTKVNGPGLRTIVHLQGCADMPCRFVCFNKHTHSTARGEVRNPADLADELCSKTDSMGYTVSGGEPFQQPAALTIMLARIKENQPKASIICFTGYTEKQAWLQFEGLDSVLPTALHYIDALVAGPYNPHKPNNTELRSSSNQELVLLSDRHHRSEFAVPLQYEVILHKDSTQTITGFPPEEASCPHS
jgi:anaerobic ribonucleoside-triphosphate reductase activating protein